MLRPGARGEPANSCWVVWSICPAVLAGIASVCTFAACGVPPREPTGGRPRCGLENAAGNVNCPDMNDASETYDVIVVGGGPAGLPPQSHWRKPAPTTALIARRLPYADNRTTALLGGSVDLLGSLDVWSRCADRAAPLRTMRLVDDTGRLIRAPEVWFSCDEIGLDQFGYNIENRTADGGAGSARGRTCRI